MDAIPGDLRTAALAARERLETFSRNTASANARPDRRGYAAALAGAAREAIFADALIAAMHARLDELKTAAK